MTNFTNVTKYMCTVETKNYPVVTIAPAIQRYSSIKKNLNASEIASCLAAYAVVTLHKNNGSNVRLTKDNFRNVLLEYKNELLVQATKKASFEESKKNAEDIEKMKNEKPEVKTEKTVAVTTAVEEKEDEIIPAETESLEELQSDPEDPDNSDWSHIYGDDDDTTEEDNKEEE